MAVLNESKDVNMKVLQKSIVLTIIGHVEEIRIEENEADYQAHLQRHPEM